ncbi:MAG TPA: FimB/Mfa2 family fimbrial subunit [Candidatus Alistipes avicola]|uniref:FimB/Mfa2 family fimbrial subunit n=1 Tax=Candidatus Alistipes avicola TaxID=2838432 RepID=A0A9D2ID14_9BACT|nr:FimB/Mfa2 family fimbrial subunit [Candidatus Alistipes avicola]
MRTKQLLLLAGMAFLTVSCAKESRNDMEIGNTLHVNLNVVSDIPVRAAATEAENLVSTFDLFLFDAESGLLEYAQQGMMASSPSSGGAVGELNVGQVSLTVADRKNKNLLAVANGDTRSVVLPEVVVGQTTYAQMLEAVAMLSSTTESPSSPYVMSGYASGVNANDNPTVNLSLRRRVSRIDVVNLSADNGLVVSAMQLKQVVNQSYLFAEGHPSEGVTYVDYDPVAVIGNSTTSFYVFPQPAATNRMTLTVTGTLNGMDFTQTLEVKPMQEGVAIDMESNTAYTVKLQAQAQEIKMECALQTVEEWKDGADIAGVITVDPAVPSDLIPFNGLLWMDRNLGATTADLEDWDNAIGDFYQWGRNTAFSATGQIETISGPLTAEAAASDENISKFITLMKGDWLDGSDDSRWQSAASQPCPEGYRMPTVADFMGIFTPAGVLVNTYTGPVSKSETLADGTFSAQYWGDRSRTMYGIKKMGTADAYYMKWEYLKTNGGNGYVKISRWTADAAATFTGKDLNAIQEEFVALGEPAETITFAAAGNITGSSGTYSNSSQGGYYWTSSLNGSTGAHRAEFTSGKMIAGDTYNSRISGHSVRCIKEQ